jgi:hypothetical protein
MSRVNLDGASQEYAAAAILHEIYHAYMLTQSNMPTDLQGQHEYMMQNYTSNIAAALQAMFPNLDAATATALALGGYGGVQANDPAFWNTILAANNVTDAQVTHANTYYKDGLSGTACQ